jgi:hypothetical protein
MSAHVKVVDKDTGWAALFKRVKQARDGRVKVGVLADDEKGADDHGGLSVAELAAVLHYGTEDGSIPARPFLAMAFDEQREELSKLGGELMSEVLEGKMDSGRALGLMGAKLAAEAKKVISTGDKLQANSPATVAAKGSSRPLVDTGRLLNAITWAIDKGHHE